MERSLGLYLGLLPWSRNETERKRDFSERDKARIRERDYREGERFCTLQIYRLKRQLGMMAQASSNSRGWKARKEDGEK